MHAFLGRCENDMNTPNNDRLSQTLNRFRPRYLAQ
jgi:hypothetical protein